MQTFDDWRAALEARLGGDADPTLVAQLIARTGDFSRDQAGIARMAKVLRERESELVAFMGVRRLAIVAGCTSAPLADAARVALFGEGLVAAIHETPIGTFQQAILGGELRDFRADVVLLAPQQTDLTYLPGGPCTDAEIDERLALEFGIWTERWSHLKELGVNWILQHDLAPPAARMLGGAEGWERWSPARFIDELNTRLRKAAPPDLCWIDISRLAQECGLNQWNSTRLWCMGRFGFDLRFLPQYTRRLAAAWRAATATARRVLVLDLDNTLWGGVIGDDGLTGIELGPDTPRGEAFQVFARYVQQLGRRGVLLAVCSKNDPQIASEVFSKHPAMPLKMSDFSAFECSWGDKVTGLKRIAKQLNLDPSQMVFVDDNQAERLLVESQLPQVATIALPAEPWDFVRAVDGAAAFDVKRLTSDDLGRTEAYRLRAKAEQERAVAGSLDDHLRSLGMTAEIFSLSDATFPRAAQLEAKTNQFNLTNRRYGESDLRALAARSDALVWGIALADRFGHHGFISLIVAIIEGDELKIDSWVMSCRVFSRTLEHFVLNCLCEAAQQRGLARVVGEYRETPRNGVVRTLFSSCGFTTVSRTDSAYWSIDLPTVPLQTFVTAAAPT